MVVQLCLEALWLSDECCCPGERLGDAQERGGCCPPASQGLAALQLPQVGGPGASVPLFEKEQNAGIQKKNKTLSSAD